MFPLSPKRWDGAAWVPAAALNAAAASATAAPPATLRLATLNILADCFPWFVKLATPPAERIAAATDRIVACDADVLGLNEVTPGILAALLGDARIRAVYTTTHAPEEIRGKHACVVLSKRPLVGAWHFPAVSELTTDKTGAPVRFGQQRLPVVVRLAEGGIDVCSIHTMAYQKGETRRLRAEQIASVVAALRAHGNGGGGGGGDESARFVVMGDMNLHDPAEDACVVGNKLLDVWAETHPAGIRAAEPGFREAEAGYTFDARRNSMIPRYIPGETRRMRLDRILVSRGFPMVPAAPCRLWADEPVDAKRDVFVSDHFGLAVDMVPCANSSGPGWQGSCQARHRLGLNAKDDPLPNPFSVLRFGVSLVGHSFWLAKRSAGL